MHGRKCLGRKCNAGTQDAGRNASKNERRDVSVQVGNVTQERRTQCLQKMGAGTRTHVPKKWTRPALVPLTPGSEPVSIVAHESEYIAGAMQSLYIPLPP